MAVQARDDLHRLVDHLGEGDLTAAQAFLEFLTSRQRQGTGPAMAVEAREPSDPIMRAFLDAPEDDEDLSPDEIAAIAAGKADVAAGDVVSFEEVERRLLGRT